ncbi:MAG: Asr1405/Asl0597 family protein [Cyanobacteria bacterium P01_F01_bin.86]
MNKPTTLPSNWGQVISVQRCDRWSIHRRLQELNIPCACPSDGTLRVDIKNPTDLLLIRSTVQQFTAPRQTSVNWLERCWETRVFCKANH